MFSAVCYVLKYSENSHLKESMSYMTNYSIINAFFQFQIIYSISQFIFQSCASVFSDQTILKLSYNTKFGIIFIP